MQTSKSTYVLILAGLGVAANVVLGVIVSTLKIPLLFLDTIGTIFVAALLGPVWGGLTGLATNLLVGFATNPKDIPFALVNIVIGLIVGLVTKKKGFGLVTAAWTGLILAVVAPLIGTPIAVWLYGGLTGGGTDLLFIWLLTSGSKIFTAAFIPRIVGNLVDKVGSAILVALVLQKMPKRIMETVAINNAKE